jgi:hypothetical protein
METTSKTDIDSASMFMPPGLSSTSNGLLEAILGNDVCGRDRSSYLRRARKSLPSHQPSAGRPHRHKRPTGVQSGGSTAIRIHASRKSERVGI